MIRNPRGWMQIAGSAMWLFAFVILCLVTIWAAGALYIGYAEAGRRAEDWLPRHEPSAFDTSQQSQFGGYCTFGVSRGSLVPQSRSIINCCVHECPQAP